MGEQLGRDWAPLFDGEIGNAAGGVEHPRLDKGCGGAGIEASGTAAAVIRLVGRVDLERQVGKDAADEKPGPWGQFLLR